MKIGILTHYNVNNQGAQLQLYALSDYLRSKGHEVFTLTYNKNFDFIPEEGQKNVVKLSSVPYYLKNYLLGKGLGLTWYNAQKYTALSKARSKNFQYLSYHTQELDAIIIGSDEVFSIDVGINSMMYGHNLRCKNTIAYAPAFGRTSIDLLKEEGCYYIVQSGLGNMKHLSARDIHTQNMIRELTGKDVPIVCDPVFLMNFNKTLAPIKKIKKPYMLVYSYDAHMKDESEYIAIKKYAKKHGLITVSAGTYHKWCDMNIVCNALEWVEYFKNAECVITDTFHGYVTALKTKKETALFVRKAINASKLQSLMKQTGTEDREFFEFTEESLEAVFAKKMDYNEISKAMDEMAQSGKEYLAEVLLEDNESIDTRNNINSAPQNTYCSGCSACVSICPTKAIHMKMNTAGFYEAKVDEEKCIHCGRCQKVCSRFGHVSGISMYDAKHYAMQSADTNVIKSCSSGGVSHELAMQAIESGKNVVGCVYDTETGKAKHICVNEQKELDKLKGSKYLQSDSSKAFLEVIENAVRNKDEKYVVFGTPCQIAGLARTAKEIGVRGQLLLIEIFCHGVPSYHVWDMQLNKIRKSLEGDPQSVLFRYKKEDWHSYCIRAQKDKKVWYGTREKEEFWHVFFENVLLNDSCMVCKERCEESLADIRLGDYWGHRFEKCTDGVSAVFAMTEAGEKAIVDLVQSGKVKTLEAGDAKEMLAAQNMAGYEIDEKHKEAMNILRSTGRASEAVSKYRKMSSKKQKIKRNMLKMSGYLPSDIRIKLRKMNSSRYVEKKLEEE